LMRSVYPDIGEQSLVFPVSTGHPGKPKFLQVADVITHCLYAVQGQENTSVSDASSKGHIVRGHIGPGHTVMALSKS
jgi:hypothetical protein